jgi:hypothetical protein
MAGGGVHAEENRRVAALGCLESGGKLERMPWDDAVIVVTRGQ